MARWHDPVRLDRTNSHIPVKQARTVRAAAAAAATATATATTIRKYRINLTLLLPFLLFIHFITATNDGFHETKIMKHRIDTAVRYNNINSNSAAYGTIIATATAITITSGSNSNSSNTYGPGRTGKWQRRRIKRIHRYRSSNDNNKRDKRSSNNNNSIRATPAVTNSYDQRQQHR